MVNSYNNIIIIGGTGRNIGKSTLMELMIKRFSGFNEIITLKTSMLLPGEEYLHGKHKLVKPDEYILIEETNRNTNKDSSRFLRAGASKSFFLSSGDLVIKNAFENFLKSISSDSFIIAESNVLAEFIKPAVFIMIVDNNNIKPSAKKLIDKADLIVPALNNKEFENAVNSVIIKGRGFLLKNSVKRQQGRLSL